MYTFKIIQNYVRDWKKINFIIEMDINIFFWTNPG